MPVRHAQSRRGRGKRRALQHQRHPHIDTALHGGGQAPLAGQQHAKPDQIAGQWRLIGLPEKDGGGGDQRDKFKTGEPA